MGDAVGDARRETIENRRSGLLGGQSGKELSAEVAGAG